MNKKILFVCTSLFFLLLHQAFAQPADAEVSTFASPANADFCPGTLPVSVNIYNNDLVDITEVVLNWNVNSVAQLPVTWSGTLAAGNIVPVELDPAYDFESGTSYFIEVTISTVNTVADPNSANDYNSFTFNAFFAATPQFYWDGCALECINCYEWVGDYDSVVWYLNGIPDPNSIDTAYYAPSQSGSYSVVGYAYGSGCLATTDSSVFVTPETHGISALGGTTFCEGDSVGLIFSASTQVTFTWTPGGSSSDTIYAATDGWYYVNGSYGPGCVVNDSFHVTVYPMPVITISYSGDTLSSDFTGAQQWYMNGSAISGATNSTYITNFDGSYYVVATDSNGCTGTSNTILITNTIYYSLATEMLLYPNPASDKLHIRYKSTPEVLTFRIFDAVGRLVLEDEMSGDKSIDITNFDTGIYQVVFTGDKKMFSQKLVKTD